MADTPFPLGVYVGAPDGSDPGTDATFEADFAAFVTTMGATPTYLNDYIDGTQPVGDWVGNASWQAWSDAQSPNAKEETPVIALPMASTAAGSPSADTQFQQIAAGQFDSVYQGILEAYADQGYKTLVLRPGAEMNVAGSTYAGDTAQDQADWVAAFRHIYTLVHQEAASLGISVTVVWNPSTTNYSNANAIQSLYPGNAYVDAIGADVYADMYPYSDGNNAAGQPTYHDWDTGQEDTSLTQWMADPINREHYWTYPAATEWSNDSSGGHSTSLDNLLQFAEQQGKPFAIPETGAGNSDAGADINDDAAFPQWLAQQLDTAQQAGEPIDFVSIWDSNGGGNYAFSNASDDKPQEAAAWAEYFGAATGAPVTLGSGSDQVVLALSEDAWEGNAEVTFGVDGVAVGGTLTLTATHSAGQDQTVTLLGNWGPGQHVVTVDFLNDAWGGNPSEDRNAYVDAASYDGIAAAGSLVLLQDGPQSLTVGTLASEPTVLGAGFDTIDLQMSEDAWEGNAEVAISVDGVQVGGVETITASRAAGQDQTITLLGTWGPGLQTVSVDFLNDAWGGTSSEDRNAYVDAASYNGIAATGSLVLLQDGSQSLTVGTPYVAPTVVGAGSDTLDLQMSEDAWQGNAQVTISVDGVQVGGTQTLTASHAAGQTQTVALLGNWGPGQHTVAVDFLNDAWGGSASQDRNAYVDGGSYDGTVQPTATLALYKGGTQSFTVTSSTTYDEGPTASTVTTEGNDIVDISTGNVTIEAMGPSVMVSGGSGTMTFIAHGGNDTIVASTGASTVTGSTGSLTFTQGTGPSRVTEGSGASVYDILDGYSGGSLTIVGFRPGTDLIHLNGYTGNAVAAETVAGGATNIVLTDHTSITLAGVTSTGGQSLFG